MRAITHDARFQLRNIWKNCQNEYMVSICCLLNCLPTVLGFILMGSLRIKAFIYSKVEQGVRFQYKIGPKYNASEL